MHIRLIAFCACLFFTLHLATAADSVSVAVIDVGWQVDHTMAALAKKGEHFTVITAKSLKDTSFHLSKYDLILVNEWWTKETQNVLNAAKDRIAKYVADGGFFLVFFSLNSQCDVQFWTSSWTPYPVYAKLNSVAQDCHQKAYDYKDEIDIEGHPLFQGIKGKYLEAGDRKAFLTSDSHWYRIAKNREKEEATILECTHEKGRYLIIGPALAPWYGGKYQQTLLFDNIVTYAKSVALKIKQDKEAQKKLEEQAAKKTLPQDSSQSNPGENKP
jgi:hypothetical protein